MRKEKERRERKAPSLRVESWLGVEFCVYILPHAPWCWREQGPPLAF